MPSDLPDFERPPVVEVVVGVQFEELGLKVPHLGLLWQKYRGRFPHVDQRPALDPVVERFGVPAPPIPSLTLMDQPPANRLWFMTEAQDELIQVQPDRLILNWRNFEAKHGYPRYEAVEQGFLSTFATFTEFLTEQGLGEGCVPISVEKRLA
jgi:uncharacterized protein (TIGR04255 family)